MLSMRELAASLYGAYRLARFDPSGMRYFDASPAAAGRSFYAAAIVAPLYAVMLVVASREGDVNYLRFGFIEGTAYVLSWVAYPIIVEWYTRLVGCRERFDGYLAAYNWSMVLQNGVIFPLAMLVGLGMVTTEAGQLLWSGVFLAILFYIGFIAWTALEISVFTAAGLVVLDVLLSALIDGVAGGLY